MEAKYTTSLLILHIIPIETQGKCKFGDYVGISKYKNIFAKGNVLDRTEKLLNKDWKTALKVINKVFPRACVSKNLNKNIVKSNF